MLIILTLDGLKKLFGLTIFLLPTFPNLLYIFNHPERI